MAEAKIIGFWGGMALLISSITGPGLTTIPLLFQQSGWVLPTIAFLVFGVLAATVSFFLVETLSAIRGNETFQSRVEYATVAHLHMGNRSHLVIQIFLYCALQSVNLSSIIISEQTIDSLLITIFHKTCALSFTKGAICVSTISESGSPFDSYILLSLGYIISAMMVIPLSMMTLVQNIKFQLASIAILFFVMVSWIVLFAKHGLGYHIPPFGSSQGRLIGFVLNNFAFITTVPSFVNELSRTVSIHRVVSYSIALCVALYFIVGLLGAASFKIHSTDILATLAASNANPGIVTLVNILFPISVLITSVPVFSIVIRYNLVRGNICSKRWATFWASWLPWILIIPFQTKGWLTLVMNWTALVFGSSTNFIIPLLFYIKSKRSTARAANLTGSLASGNVFILSSDANSQGSTQAIRREQSSIAAIAAPAIEDAIAVIPPSPLLNVYSASLASHQESQDGTDPSIDSLEEVDLTRQQDNADLSLDPSRSIPLRTIYSSAVSHTTSVTHNGGPSIVVTHSPEANGEAQITRRETFPEASRGRSNSFQSEINPDGTVHHRARPHSTSGTSSLRVETLTVTSTRITQFPTAQSSSQTGTLTIEEVGDVLGESGNTSAFKAFPEWKWLNSVVVAWVALVIVSAAVLANLVYSIVETAKGKSPFTDD